MNEALVGAGAPRRGASMIDRRAEDRWVGAPVRRASLAMSAIVLASLAIHAGVILAALLFTPADPVAHKEISVELVQEPPPPPAAAEKAGGAKSEPATAPAAPEPVKPEAKADEPKPPPPEPEKPKAEAPKVEESKPEQPKPEQLKPEQPKPEESKPDLRGPDHADADLAEKQKALDSLKQELDGLKAEQAALKDRQAEAAAQPEPPQPPTGQSAPMLADGKIGPIPPSFGAVALPALSDIDGEETGYQQIVFGQLAKAKGIRRHMGMPGTAGVVFSIDGDGKLVDVHVAQKSGSDALDAEALDVVKAAQPFPKPPPGAQRVFSANFNFVPQAAP